MPANPKECAPTPATAPVSKRESSRLAGQYQEVRRHETAQISTIVLAKLIDEAIAEKPHKHDGQKWIARSQADWVNKLRELNLPIKERRLRDIIKNAIKDGAVVRQSAMIDGVKTMLLRTGKPGSTQRTHYDLAKYMANIWRKRFGRLPGGKGFNMLLGLANDWPDGSQVDTFRAALDDWEVFMFGVRIIQNDTHEQGEKVWFLKKTAHPSIGVIRKYHPIGVQLLGQKLQKESKDLPGPLYVAYMNSELIGNAHNWQAELASGKS